MSISIGIEIGGTKIQAGVGLRNDRLLARARTQVNVEKGAQGILEAIPVLVDEALRESGRSLEEIVGVGVGFGGPVDTKRGVALVSHQIDGWDQFPLLDWLQEQWSVPAAIQNDASLAGYAEALLGAGKGRRRIFYMTIGSGIGGGWIVDGKIEEGQGLGAAEIGHTWIPEPDTGEPQKLEWICSGWGIGNRAREAVEEGEASILTELCDRDSSRIDAKMVYAAVERDDLLACTILDETCTALALAICNAVSLLHPERVVIGGGVSLMGPLFWDNLQEKIQRYVFQPFAGTFDVVPASLGEDVVVVGGALLGLEIAGLREKNNS
ncbi:MAG: ROK family protein [Candidatus Omnitrophica bacterium]|nr:ROK family protein [Candidatus Omnitrophota bacterium]